MRKTGVQALRAIKDFHHDESGAAMTEYALLIIIIALSLIATLGLFRDKIKELFTKIMDSIGGVEVTE